MAVSWSLIVRLNRLLQLDHDASDAYEQAIKRLDNAACRTKLEAFQEDHRRHMDELRKCIAHYGGQAADHMDFRGLVLSGFTAVQAMAGDELTLKAMQTNEGLVSDRYEEEMDDRTLPEDVAALVAANRADEDRHLEWLNRAVAQRFWEKSGSSAT